jgi:hypothetical protein
MRRERALLRSQGFPGDAQSKSSRHLPLPFFKSFYPARQVVSLLELAQRSKRRQQRRPLGVNSALATDRMPAYPASASEPSGSTRSVGSSVALSGGTMPL